MPSPAASTNPADLLTPSALTELLRSCPALYCFPPSDDDGSGGSKSSGSRPSSAIRVASISVRDVEEGVLSRVVSVSLTYANKSGGSNDERGDENDARAHDRRYEELARDAARPLPPAGLIIKFLRPSAPQRRMFRTEGAFYASPKYSQLRDGDTGGVPFRVPRCILASEDCIVLERIEVGPVGNEDGRRKLVDGCRPGKETDSVVRTLAIMHARCWVGCGTRGGTRGGSSSGDGVGETAEERYAFLDPTPGVGMAMSGVDKERLFVARWGEYLDGLTVGYGRTDSDSMRSSEGRGGGGIIVTEAQKERLTAICRKLAKLRLRELHDKVVSYKPTLIHGDFHVANLIFPRDNGGGGAAAAGEEEAAPYLIDWATCGAGNPLFDLTFFLLVSTPHGGGEDSIETERLLRLYYDTLTDVEVSDNASGIAPRDGSDGHQGPMLSSYESFLKMYRSCVLNEFLILVAYDRLARQFVDAAETEDKREERARHFGNVARRTVGAVLSDLIGLEESLEGEEVEGGSSSGGGSKYVDDLLPPAKTEADLREEATALEELMQGRDGNKLGMEL